MYSNYEIYIFDDKHSFESNLVKHSKPQCLNIQHFLLKIALRSLIFKDSLRFELLTNLDTEGTKRSVMMLLQNSIGYFSSNILCGLSADCPKLVHYMPFLHLGRSFYIVSLRISLREWNSDVKKWLFSCVFFLDHSLHFFSKASNWMNE